LKAAHQLSASQLSSSLLLQTKGQRFSVQPLPWMAQLSSYSDALVVQANADNLPDVLLIGNFYDNTIQMGRNDADFGLLLLNKGGGQFECELLNGAMLYGESRKVRAIKLGGKQAFIVARNNAAAMVLAFQR
jgi:TRAP-type C4-dicarboxylate transport system substrate-binding protein